MPLTKETVKILLERAGVSPSAEQVEATTGLHNLLEKQLADVPEELLENVEPHYIQPIRRDRRRSLPS